MNEGAQAQSGPFFRKSSWPCTDAANPTWTHRDKAGEAVFARHQEIRASTILCRSAFQAENRV